MRKNKRKHKLTTNFPNLIQLLTTQHNLEREKIDVVYSHALTPTFSLNISNELPVPESSTVSPSNQATSTEAKRDLLDSLFRVEMRRNFPNAKYIALKRKDVALKVTGTDWTLSPHVEITLRH
jgi:hypothetical protein